MAFILYITFCLLFILSFNLDNTLTQEVGIVPINAVLTTDQPTCEKPNEEYNLCGTACPDTCENYGKPRICTRQCVIGCFCKTGYVRDSNGDCILVEECPPKEPETPKCSNPNEVYLTCGTACPSTCRNYNSPGICTFNCVVGCFCDEGYVRDDNNRCVLIADCPKYGNCKVASFFETKPKPGVACERQCDGPIQCSAPPKGKCVCTSGNFRDSLGQCVPLSKCPAGCSGANEIYDSRVLEDLKCTSINKKNVPKAAPVEGCYCKTGYARDKKGVCVSINKCTKNKY